MPCPADPSIFRWGDRLEDVRLGVYAVDAIEAGTECGEVIRWASIVACETALGAYVDVDGIGSEPMPAVEE